MKVYALLLGAECEGSTLLGIYQYLSQAQEAEYAYRLNETVTSCEWTEIREVTLGAAPVFEAGKAVEW